MEQFDDYNLAVADVQADIAVKLKEYLPKGQVSINYCHATDIDCIFIPVAWRYDKSITDLCGTPPDICVLFEELNTDRPVMDLMRELFKGSPEEVWICRKGVLEFYRCPFDSIKKVLNLPEKAMEKSFICPQMEKNIYRTPSKSPFSRAAISKMFTKLHLVK